MFGLLAVCASDWACYGHKAQQVTQRVHLCPTLGALPADGRSGETGGAAGIRGVCSTSSNFRPTSPRAAAPQSDEAEVAASDADIADEFCRLRAFLASRRPTPGPVHGRAEVTGHHKSHFQWPPCVLQTSPVLLHLLQVRLLRPPLHPWQSCRGAWHLVHFMLAIPFVVTLPLRDYCMRPARWVSANRGTNGPTRDTNSVPGW